MSQWMVSKYLKGHYCWQSTKSFYTVVFQFFHASSSSSLYNFLIDDKFVCPFKGT